MTNVVAHFFVTYYMGLPLQGSPLVFLPPQLLHRMSPSHPHPFEKGRGGCGCTLTCEVSEVLMAEPHPSIEELVSGWLGETRKEGKYMEVRARQRKRLRQTFLPPSPP